MREIFCEKEVLLGVDQINKTIVLKEEENNQYITIGGIPDDSIFLKLDVNKTAYKQKSQYLKGGEPFIHKGCDYCLIIPSMKLIILFELKSFKPKVKNYVDQFVASEIFIDYCKRLSDYKKCSVLTYSYKRILLSPKYNHIMTSKRILDISQKDQCGKNIEIKTPGFPSSIRLESLLKI